MLAGIQQYAVLLTGSTMSGPLFLSPLMPTADAQAATKAYVDAMLATAGIPEVPPVPVGQIWGRETGQWVPISQAGGTFLPISGGSMQGSINMSGNTITNMAAVPAMPNGAAPAQWVLNQIASVSLYQGTWNADTNVPDLTQLSTHVNAYTWIAITTSPSGVVIGPAIPGLQGQTVFNGDTIIFSAAQGRFSAIHAGGITLPEADGRYVQLAGSQMSGALLLNANASQNMQAVPFQQLEAAVANTVTPDAPADGQAYLRVGVGANRWVPGLPLAGGILTGALTLAGPGASGNNAVTVAQMNSAITAGTTGLLPIAGGTMTGPIVLAGNAAANLNPVPLQQVNSMLALYAPLQNPAFTGIPAAPTATAGTNTTQLATCAFAVAGDNARLPLTGGVLTGSLRINSTAGAQGQFVISDGTATMSLQVTSPNISLGGLGVGGLTINAGTGGISTLSNLAVGGTLNVSGDMTAHGGQVSINNAGASYAFTVGHQIAFGWNGSQLVGYVDGNSIGGITSDARLKTNFEPVAIDPLDVVGRIPLQQFDWLPTQIGDAVWQKPHNSCGFTAQDLAPLIPEAVLEGDELGIDLLPLMGHVIGAIQHLSARVAALETRAMT